MKELLFVYGTLKDSAVQRKIVGRELMGESDVLEEHTTEQATLDDGVYPILIGAAGESVDGLVLKVLVADFSALDKYEGAAYERVKVKLKSGKEAWVYKKARK